MAKKKIKADSIHLGRAAEKFVQGELVLQNVNALLTEHKERRTDIICIGEPNRRIEVRAAVEDRGARCGSRKSQWGDNFAWARFKKSDEVIDDCLFYVCVLFTKMQERPRFFILTSKEVSDYLKKEHKFWKKNKKGSRVPDDYKLRTLRLGIGENSHGLKPIKDYEDRWDKINVNLNNYRRK